MAYIFSDLKNIAELKQSRGGRISSSSHRKSYEQVEDFTGLEENVNRYDLLLLVKRMGKKAGFTPRMISLLDYYMAFTRDCDWEQGSSPIVYQSISKTALDLGVSERQVQRLEQSLFKVGALTWHDSGNHRRYGNRDEQGRIMYAYGVDLTPLAYLKAELSEKLQEKRMIDAAWMETKRQISYYRGQIKAVMCEMELLTLDGQGDYTGIITELDKKYAPISLQIRTHLPLEKLRTLLASHKELYALAVDALEEHDTSAVDNSSISEDETIKMSPKNDSHDVHYNSTIKKQSNKLDTTSMASPRSFQKAGKQPLELQKVTDHQAETCSNEDESFTDEEALILQTGLQHITLKQALNAASESFRDHMPMANRPMNWNDFVDAAYKMKGELMISQASWGRACATLGRNGAAICLLLTDQAQQREHKPVQKTGAYFNAMITRAKEGELHLHNSVFGILKKEYGDMAAA
tara:strand:- start:2095 stop:3486 length:1392 start_codon:yes stop_codon:yes gene_type:complete